MEEVTNWIDKTIDEISNTDLFKLYFANSEIIVSEDRYYLNNLAEGIELVLSETKVITAIHFFGSQESFFKGLLPFNLNFYLSRNQIISRFGNPFRSGERHRNLYLGIVQSWDKYLLADYSIRLEYNDKQDRILKISVISLSLEKYLNAKLQ